MNRKFQLSMLYWRAFIDAVSIDEEVDDQRQNVSGGINLLCLLIGVVAVIFCLMLFLVTKNYRFIEDGTIAATSLAIVYALNRRLYYEMANVLFYLLMNVIAIQVERYLGGSENLIFSYFFLFLLIIIVFFNFITRLFCVVILFARAFLFELHITSYNESSLVPQASHTIVQWGTNAVFIMLTLVIFFMYNRWRARQKELAQKKEMYVLEIFHDTRNGYAAVDTICAALKEAADGNIVLSDLKSVFRQLFNANVYFGSILDNFFNIFVFRTGEFDQVHYEEVDIITEIKKMIDAFSYQAVKNNIQVYSNFDNAFPEVIRTDRVKVVRIFANLFANALKYTPSRKSVSIGVRTEEKVWVLSIVNERDSNSEEELVVKVPTMKNSLDNRNSKKGFGLPITKELVNKLGGSMQVDNGNDNNISFKVSIPYLK